MLCHAIGQEAQEGQDRQEGQEAQEAEEKQNREEGLQRPGVGISVVDILLFGQGPKSPNCWVNLEEFPSSHHD